MIFWQSSEATQYGYTLISAFVRKVEQKINAQLSQITLRSAYQTWKWAFIVMIIMTTRKFGKRTRKIKFWNFA